MKVRALKKRAGRKQCRLIRRRAADRAFQAVGDGVLAHLTAVRSQWNAALREMARAITSAVAEAVKGQMFQQTGASTSKDPHDGYHISFPWR